MRATRLALAFALVGASLSLHAQNFSSLEERMSQREYESAGLQKLSAEELAYLNRWLLDRGLTASTAAANASDRVGLPVEHNPANDIVRSRLLGSFRGWNGDTVFRLENGQVWQQTGGGVLAGVNLDSPPVTIKKSLFGVWHLSVEGYNSRAKVQRLE